MNLALRKRRYDDRHVPRSGDHWIASITCALTRNSSVSMDVGNNGESAFATDRPEGSISAAIEHDDPCIQRMRIEVVVVHDAGDTTSATCEIAQQERTTFGLARTATPELREQLTPHPAGTRELMFRSYEGPYSRWN